ncbi:predicted protein, partial [Nematostella vectensis]
AYFVKLQIFYEELNHEVIEEYRSYELVNFVSDIGGQLGLWIGISALTASEFIELLIVIALHLLRKVTRIGLIDNSAEQPADTNPCYLDDITLTGDLKERRGALTESNTSLTVRYLAEVARKRNKKGHKEKREASWHIDEEAFPCYRDQATIHPNVESNTSLTVRYLDDIVQKKSKHRKRSKERPLTMEEKKEQAFTGEVSQPDPATLDKQTLKTEELVLSLATKPEDMLMEAGHQFNDMVLSCTYRGIPCT